MEGQNMIFAKENTSVVVPQAYALYSNPETGENYTVMEQIHRETLLSLWPELSQSDKDLIMTTLRSYFDEMRRLPSPGYYGSLGGGAVLDEIFWTKEAEASINGPFASEDAVNEAFARKYVYDGRPPFRAEFYRQCLPHILHGYSPTFTHGDFQRKNIIVQRSEEEDQMGQEVNQGMRVVLSDWEKSGCYPSHWEYCLAVCAL
ncbi:hypothetical protein BJY01DRAFT_252505 [Aspergillus pseudoustus]|uniref:Aminoglycoside phosphotransferase domain-containing protein n=1 Tax=Aspergillus pseudoustus TaxID=1810923 RepID=A0ABR4J6D0_9EURO